MTNITINFQPFLNHQIIYAYVDGAIVDEVAIPLADMPKAVKAMATKYNATEINMIGNQDYLSRFKAEMATDFSNDININIIGR